jgi:hypothetical protein
LSWQFLDHRRDQSSAALPAVERVGEDNTMDGDLIVQVESDESVSDEEIAEFTRQLKDDLDDLAGVEVTDVPAPAEEGTRGSGDIILGALAISAFAYPTAMRVKADLKHLADIIKRHQSRHRGKRVTITLADGTKVDVENISEKYLAEILESVPRQQAGDQRSRTD